jgi:hypothetical protein
MDLADHGAADRSANVLLASLALNSVGGLFGDVDVGEACLGGCLFELPWMELKQRGQPL